jgi:hypothetical protein
MTTAADTPANASPTRWVGSATHDRGPSREDCCHRQDRLSVSQAAVDRLACGAVMVDADIIPVP